MRCVAGILVGGGSKRMGQSKGLLTLPGGLTMVEQAVRVTQGRGLGVEETVLLGCLDPLPPSLSALQVLSDAALNAGPLAGLCSLLTYAADRWAMLLPCDMPLLDSQVLARLLAEARPNVDAVAFLKADQPLTYHACCALYHPRLLGTADNRLTKGKRSLQGLLAHVRTAALHPTSEEARKLINVNTRAEHERALRSLNEQFGTRR